MKNLSVLILLLVSFSLSSCSNEINKDKLIAEVKSTEESFAQMTAEKGIAEAFYFYADENAVIKRQNDTLIHGAINIRDYYNSDTYSRASVNWTPDFIDVSDCGTMAYTYGKYIWKFWNVQGDTSEFRGVFHTVWKKQSDESWKYVWD